MDMRSILEVNLTELENKTLYIHRIFKRFKLKQDENGDAIKRVYEGEGPHAVTVRSLYLPCQLGIEN